MLLLFIVTNSPVKQKTIEQIIIVTREERFKFWGFFVFPLMSIYFCPSFIILGRIINAKKDLLIRSGLTE